MEESRDKDEQVSAEVEMGVPAAEETKTEKEEPEEEERWYLADDGESYFIERREPFFRLNLVALVVAMAAFIYLAVQITQDFIDQQENPPTSTKISRDISQPFPGMIMCNRDLNASLEVLFAFFDDTGDSDDVDVDIADQVKPLQCGKKQRNCVMLDGDFPAFSVDPQNANVCSERNTIAIAMNVDLASYSNDTFFAGIDGFFFMPGKGDSIASVFCQEDSLSCSSIPPSDSCPEDVAAISVEPFVASSSQGTLFTLTRSEIQHGPTCEQTLVSWSPVGTNMHFVPPTYGLGALVDSLVLLSFEFSNPRVSKTTYNPMSGQSMFGSLSGWWGFLTDGWGAISVLFFSERTFMYLRHRFRR